MACECSYAGVPFRLPTADVIAHVEKFGLLDDLCDMSPSANVGRAMLALGRPNLPAPHYPKLGEFWFPCGMSRCAIFRGIATGADVAAMQAAVFAPLDGESADQGATFVMQNDGLGGTQSISAYLFMLPPRPLAIVDSDAEGGLWLVTLVDDRYMQRFTLAEFSGTTGAQIVATCSASSSTDTWAGLLDWYASGILPGFTVPGSIPSAYGQPEPDSALYGAMGYETPVILDAIASNIGGFITINQDANNTAYFFQTWNAALAATKAARLAASQRLAGGAIFNPDTSVIDPVRTMNLAEAVVVSFPCWTAANGYAQPENYRDFYKRGNTYGQNGTVLVRASSLGDPYSTYPEALWEGYYKFLRTTAKFNSGTISACEALATQLAKDYYDYEVAALDEIYQGIQAWPANTGHDVLYMWTADACFTRVMRAPFNSAVVEFQHGFGPVESPLLGFQVAANSVLGNASGSPADPGSVGPFGDEQAVMYQSTSGLGFYAAPRWVSVPASSSASGTKNQIATDGNYLYVCIGTNSWVRTALSTW